MAQLAPVTEDIYLTAGGMESARWISDFDVTIETGRGEEARLGRGRRERKGRTATRNSATSTLSE